MARHQRRRTTSVQLLTLLLVALASSAAAEEGGNGTAPAAPPPTFIPDDVPGAEQARAWLQRYSEGRQQRMPNWPAQVQLAACPDGAQEQPAGGRPFLVLAVVGSRWQLNASGWLDDPAAAAFDLVLVSYGDAAPACPQCLHTFRRRGPK